MNINKLERVVPIMQSIRLEHHLKNQWRCYYLGADGLEHTVFGNSPEQVIKHMQEERYSEYKEIRRLERG